MFKPTYLDERSKISTLKKTHPTKYRSMRQRPPKSSGRPTRVAVGQSGPNTFVDASRDVMNPWAFGFRTILLHTNASTHQCDLLNVFTMKDAISKTAKKRTLKNRDHMHFLIHSHGRKIRYSGYIMPHTYPCCRQRSGLISASLATCSHR